MKAIWNNKIIAESNDTIVIEGNHYFPEESLNKEFIELSDTHSVCPWKGTANYYSIKIGDKLNKDAVWYYPTPSLLAKGIKNRIAFWKGVAVVD